MFKKILMTGVILGFAIAAHLQPSHQSAAQGISVVRSIKNVTPLAENVGRYEKFEIVVELDATFDNPYDPDQIRLDAEFTGPSGQVMTVPGFYYQEFEQELTPERERLAATDNWSWRVRFTPTEVGEWTYRVIATAPASGPKTKDGFSFTATESDKRGFVRIDSRNPRYLAFDDGSPFFPIGENMAWYGSSGMADYLTWLDPFAAAGGNYIRVWLASWGFNFEWTETGLGNYDARQNRAFQLDTLFELVEERDVYIMLCLINHGQFNTGVNPEWDSNPYNVANGGPLNEPVEFASNPEAIKFWHQKLRYIAARWGYSPNIMAWEWWNEVNWTPLVDPDILGPWVEQSAAYLKPLDPYDHLITHSGSAVDAEAVWAHTDFTQNHLYDLQNFPREFASEVAKWWRRYPDKPFLMGEFGSPQDYDQQAVLFHLGLWSLPMNGAFGTGMLWWWDNYIHPNNLYGQFTAISNFYAGEDLAAHEWQVTEAEPGEDSDVIVYGLQSEQNALLWVLSRDYSQRNLEKQYLDNLRARAEDPFNIVFPDVAGASINLAGLAAGAYSIEIWDSQSGTVIETQSAEVTDGTLSIALPTFSHDLALKVKGQ